jgi:hypothetical protein
VEDGCGRRLLVALVTKPTAILKHGLLGPLRSGALRSDIGYAAEAVILVSHKWIALCGDDHVHATATP